MTTVMIKIILMVMIEINQKVKMEYNPLLRFRSLSKAKSTELKITLVQRVFIKG